VGRALHAFRLLRAGRVQFILISAGNVPWYQAREPEAQWIARLLKEWGIPDDVLILESQSRNTFENARLSKPIWDSHGFKKGLLVTSAFQMPRALAVFRQAGFDVEPAPTNSYRGDFFEEGVLAILPSAAQDIECCSKGMARIACISLPWLGVSLAAESQLEARS
jgi:uncharacterized SAM-binding protein YcdF (DUF218 family)